jgi:hypothetical protein
MATNPENNANHDKSGQTGPSPREYNKHQRHAKFSRERHSAQALAFLAAQAARLTTTEAVIFTALTKYGSARVKAATNISQLP